MIDRRAALSTTSVAPHSIPPPGRPGSGTLTGIVVGVVVICALYFGSVVLIPITLALLLCFVLSPLMELLRRLWLPRVVAALLAVLIAIGVIIALGGVIGTQIAKLAEQAPQYQTTIENKIDSLRNLVGTNLSRRFSGLMNKIQNTGSPAQKPAAQPTQSQGGPGTSDLVSGSKPVPVVITQSPASSALDLSRRILEPLLSPIATLGIILVVAVFALLQKEDLRDRLIRLFGSSDLHRTTTAMDDAGQRLTRYFLTQLGINCSFGAIVGIGLYFIGVPSAVLWGILGAILRFVPYIGSYIAAALPIVLAAAVGNGWSMALWTAALYIATELIMGQAVEPMVYGRSTGLSPFSVIIAAIFWTWIWGPIGLILSTPLTLCLVVLGRHVEQLAFLDVMLGDRPALTPTENFYQRILAGDPDEVVEQAERFLAEHSLSAYYDEVALEGLQLAAADAKRGVMAPQQVEQINQVVKELVDDLADHSDVEPSPVKRDGSTGEAPGHRVVGPDTSPDQAVAVGLRSSEWQGKLPVLCIAGRGPLDEAASSMLAQLLEKHQIGVRTVAYETVSRTRIATLDMADVAMVCLSYLDISGSPGYLRFLIRRIKQRFPATSVLVGIWPADDPFLQDLASRQAAGADFYVSSLREALNICLAAAHNPPGED